MPERPSDRPSVRLTGHFAFSVEKHLLGNTNLISYSYDLRVTGVSSKVPYISPYFFIFQSLTRECKIEFLALMVLELGLAGKVPYISY